MGCCRNPACGLQFLDTVTGENERNDIKEGSGDAEEVFQRNFEAEL